MMDRHNNIEGCERARALIDLRLDLRLEGSVLAEADDAALANHLESCPGCRAWQSQMTEMAGMAAAMPQFDVSEALTQRILKAAADISPAASTEGADGRLPAYLPLTLMAVASVLWMYLLVLISVESVDGLASWAVSLAGMIALRMLIGGRQPSHQTAQGG